MFEKRLQAARQNTVEKEKQEFGKSCIRVQTIRRLWMFRLAAAACCVLTPPLNDQVPPTEKTTRHGAVLLVPSTLFDNETRKKISFIKSDELS